MTANGRPTRHLIAICFVGTLLSAEALPGQRYAAPDGRLRIALVKQPFSPTGLSKGPTTMADGGIQQILSALGATTRVEAIGLTAESGSIWLIRERAACAPSQSIGTSLTSRSDRTK